MDGNGAGHHLHLIVLMGKVRRIIWWSLLGNGAGHHLHLIVLIGKVIGIIRHSLLGNGAGHLLHLISPDWERRKHRHALNHYHATCNLTQSVHLKTDYEFSKYFTFGRVPGTALSLCP